LPPCPETCLFCRVPIRTCPEVFGTMGPSTSDISVHRKRTRIRRSSVGTSKRSAASHTFEGQISSRGCVARGNVSRRWCLGEVQDQHLSCPRSGNHMSEGRPHQKVTRASDQACGGPLCGGTPSGRRLEEGAEKADKKANLRPFGRARKTRQGHPRARRSDRPGRA